MQVVEAILAIDDTYIFDVVNCDTIVWLDERVQPTGEIVDDMIFKLERERFLNLKYKLIEEFIYTNYDFIKQNQDEKWVSSYTTKLKAYGIEGLELKIVLMARSILAGESTLDDAMATIDEGFYKYFFKLLKVALRTEWAELSIAEGLLAIEEDREPIYPIFPIF